MACKNWKLLSWAGNDHIHIGIIEIQGRIGRLKIDTHRFHLDPLIFSFFQQLAKPWVRFSVRPESQHKEAPPRRPEKLCPLFLPNASFLPRAAGSGEWDNQDTWQRVPGSLVASDSEMFHSTPHRHEEKASYSSKKASPFPSLLVKHNEMLAPSVKDWQSKQKKVD